MSILRIITPYTDRVLVEYVQSVNIFSDQFLRQRNESEKYLQPFKTAKNSCSLFVHAYYQSVATLRVACKVSFAIILTKFWSVNRRLNQVKCFKSQRKLWNQTNENEALPLPCPGPQPQESLLCTWQSFFQSLKKEPFLQPQKHVHSSPNTTSAINQWTFCVR